MKGTAIIYFLLWTSVALWSQEATSYQAALDKARASNDYQELAKAYYDFALYEENVNRNLEKSFQYLSRSLEYYELIGSEKESNLCNYHISRLLLENGMQEEAYDKLTDLQSYYAEHKQEDYLVLTEIQLFDYYFDKLEIENASQLLSSIESKVDGLENKDIQFEFLIRKVAYNELLKQYKAALADANLCLQITGKKGTQVDRAQCLIARGKIYFKLEQFFKAIADFEQSLQQLASIPYSKHRLDAYDHLSKCNEAVGKMTVAYGYSQRYASLQDSILNENRIIAINNLTYKYQSKEKATEIKLLEQDKAFVQQSNQQQKRALVVLGLALAGLLIGIYYIIRFYSDRIRAAKIIEEQKEEINKQKIVELQDRIQINSMQSMIAGQEVERARIAKDLHDSLGGLLSTIKLQVGNIRTDSGSQVKSSAVNHATKLLDVAVSEIRTISQDLQPGALKRLGLVSAINDLVNRYQSESGPEITFQHYDLPKDLNQNFALGIYRIVQEILNNAIKHAQASEIFVQLNKEDDDIVIHIEDDGIGFDPNKKYKSMGLANIRSRVNYLKGSIDIDSRENEGTSFIIHLDSKYEQSLSS